MSRKILSLHELCLEEIAQLLKNSYYNINYFFTFNPFTYIPSSIVDSLIIHVTRLSVSTPLQTSDLTLLLMSGQVREFILEDVDVSSETLDELFMCLAPYSEKLITIKLKNVFCTLGHRLNIRRKVDSLNCLISMAVNLKHVESCIEFSLQELNKCYHLEKLMLNFPFNGHLFDFLEVDGEMRPHNSLKYLEVYEDVRQPISYLDIAVILKYCTELIDINCDISKSLLYLHAEELYNGTLTAKYMLQKCYLGSIYLTVQDAAVSSEGVYIATLTCPYLKDISVLVNDNATIYALSDFQHLTSLLLQWEALQGGYFSFGIQTLLEKSEFGYNLTCLHIIHFSNIDFSSIGICCPNLEILRVEYISESNRNKFSPVSFQKLNNLHLENIDDLNCNEDTLVGILCNATNLKYLTIQPAGSLRDEVLANILAKNSLSKLKELRITNCVLSSDGIRNLASNLTSLEYLELSTTGISLDDFAAVIHDINPQVILSSTIE